MKTSFVGYPLREGALMSNHTIMFLFPMIVLLSLGGIFGRIRFPLIVAFFAWTAALEKILTMDNLKKRYVILVE